MITAAVTIALTLYAVFSNDDVTYLFGFAIILGVVTMILVIFVIFVVGKFLDNLYCSLSGILFGLYLIFDIKMVTSKIKVGGVSYRYSYDDYIIAAI